MQNAIYDEFGIGYAGKRRPDARLARLLLEALGSSTSVVNVGAGTGSYEPKERFVVAVDPSHTMLRQRPLHAAPAILGLAEALPLADRSVDAAMAVLTIHHWGDVEAGLDELRRVVRDRVVILTVDPAVISQHWFVTDYAPEMLGDHVSDMPTLDRIGSRLPGATVTPWPVPADCSDLFFIALWARPELHLDAEVRAASSVWHELPPDVVERSIGELRSDLESGRWAERHGELRSRPALDVGVRLITVDL